MRIPKHIAVGGAVLSAAAWIVQHSDLLSTIPALHGSTLPSVLAGSGLLLALFGTPPHVPVDAAVPSA